MKYAGVGCAAAAGLFVALASGFATAQTGAVGGGLYRSR